MNPTRRRDAWIQLICAAAILGYFCYFAIPGLSARFTGDDMMNLDLYWLHGPWALIRAVFFFFSTYYRPMAGVFYMSIFHFAGLNPLPYRIVVFVILLANIWLAYRFATLLTGSRAIGGLTAFFTSYQAGLGDVTCNSGVIYDILCFTFYFSAFVYYLRLRVRGQIPGWQQTAAFLAIYICALDSKEMAVSLPVMVLVYELIFHAPARYTLRSVIQWTVREGRAAFAGAIVTVVFIAGKLLGDDPLTKVDAYRPVFTLHNYAETVTRLYDGLFRPGYPRAPQLFIAAIFLAIAILTSPSRRLRYCCLHIAITLLPIAFIPARGTSCFYVVLPGVAIAVATILWSTIQAVRRLPFEWQEQRVLQGTLLVLVLIPWIRFTEANKGFVQTWLASDQSKIWSVIEELRRVNPRIPPGSSIVFLSDPFEDWTTEFISHLWFRDHSLRMWLNQKTPLSQQDVATMDYIFKFDGPKLVQVKPARSGD
ncbi:MAG TPA: hypothetical protein VKU01_29250 [Bryobacteraceae bacterium]|nr:hypothetical protein [Bryobacteraceae bacterium]